MSRPDPFHALRALLLPAAIGLAACGSQEGTACMEVADDAAECPASEDVDKDELFGSCGSTIKKLDGEGTLMPFYGFGLYTVDSGVEPGQQCCYPVKETKPTCVYGRPFVVDGSSRVAQAHTGRGWRGAAEPVLDKVPAEAREELARAWIEAALDEHAAVAAFGKVALDLLALGAPPELIAATHRAAIEEVEHARMGFALASAYAGREVGPEGFPLGPRVELSASLLDFAVATAREGCIGETLTTLVVALSLEQVTDPAVRRVLEQILAEEQGHAALAWRTVRWAIEAGGAPVRDAVAAVFSEVLRDGMALPDRVADGPHSSWLTAHGVPERAVCEQAIRRGLVEVIAPAARALLHPADPEHAEAEQRC